MAKDKVEKKAKEEEEANNNKWRFIFRLIDLQSASSLSCF